MKKKQRQRIKRANKLLISVLFVGTMLSGSIMPSLAVEPSAYTLTEVGETENYNYYDTVNGTKTYYQITPKNGTHYDISSGGTDFTIKSLTTGADSYHVTPQGTSETRVGNFNATIGSEDEPVVFHSIYVNPEDPDKGGAVYNHNNTEGHSIYADFVLNETTNYGGGVRNGYKSSAIIDKIVGNFVKNKAGTVGGAIANGADCDSTYTTVINEIIGNFIGNNAYNGGAIYNQRTIGKITGDFLSNSSTEKGGAITNTGTIGNTADGTGGIEGNFVSNTSQNGAAISNEGTISNIVGDFILNTATVNGGAINNKGSSSKITNITGNFSHNSANGGGAIYNFESGEISNIAGNFESNSATGNGGAICNFGGLSKIGNIAGNFKGNHANNSGAIHNGGIIENIIGDFENNSATNMGGAIVNGKTINKVTGNFTNNSAKNGGAVYNTSTINFVAENDKNITFSGNYVTDESGYGGAIFNATSGTVGLYASADHSITFTGDTTGLPSTANNVDSIHNLKILNINGDGTITPYTGTVNLYNVTDAATARGITNIYGGKVNVKGTFTQKDLNLKAGTFSLGKGGTVTNLNAEGGALSMSIADATYTNTIDTLNVDNYDGSLTNFTVDYDADAVAGSNMDKITINTGAGTGSSITLTSVNVIKDGTTMADGTFLNGTLTNITDNTESVTSTTTSGGWKYIFTHKDKGVVSVTREAGKTLSQEIQDPGGSDAYSINNTPYMSGADLGSLAGTGRNFTINGNGNTIDGTNPASGKFNGITVGNSSGQEFTLENATMQNFTTAITNKTGATTNINGVTFANNDTDIANNGTLKLSGTNTIDKIIGTGSTTITEGMTTVNNNLIQDNLTNNGVLTVGASALNVKNGITNNDLVRLEGGELTTNINGGNLNIIDETNKVVNNATINVSDIYIFASPTTSAELENNSTIIANNIDNAGVLAANNNSYIKANINGGTFNSNGNNTIVGNITSNGLTNPATLNLNSGTLYMQGDLSVANTVANGGSLNMADGVYRSTNFGDLSFNNNMNLLLDTNLATASIDQISANSVSGTGKINMALNIPSRIDTVITNPNITLNPIANGSDEALKDVITHNSQTVTTPIFNYTTNYDKETGLMNFVGGGGYEGFNPSVMAGAVAAQVGGYLNQLTSYDNAFEHMDSYMNLTRSQRTAMKMLNRYASAGANLPTYNPNQLADESRGIWFKPYATFEKVNLKGGPNVENTAYGSFVGGDSDLIELKNGWDVMYSAYASYDGSHQNYDGVSVYQNGGHLGGTATWYKGNFFTGLTANVGASVAEASTMYGTDNMTMLMAGVASKTGYNWELLNSKLIIQPSMLLSYSFVNMFDYTNSAGVAIDSDPLHAIQIAPGLKFIGNLPHGWQPYIGVQMVWNIMDETKFSAANVNLPQLSTRPYFQYGIGVQKKWGDRFSGYLQAMLRNGGRTGIALSAGFRWALGKDVKNPNFNKTSNSIPELPKTKIILSSASK